MPRFSRFKGILLTSLSLLALKSPGLAADSLSVTARQRPNFVVILADDLGYSDIGCYGSEIETPHLDNLAAGGRRFTQVYNTARCWPTRAAMLAGYYAQQVRRDTVPGLPSGSQGTRPSWAPLLPVALKPQGYRSYHSGKWHIDSTPIAAGFDRSYWLEDCGRNFHPQVHYADDVLLPAVPLGSGYYSTTHIVEQAISHLQDHAQHHKAQPFFEYVAFVAPHFPLQALPEDIAKYKDTYRVGWDVIRQKRWEKMQQLGLVSGELSKVEYSVGPRYDLPKQVALFGPDEINRPQIWEELTPSQQEFQATKMAIHAAMIDRIDQEIGRLLQQIRDMGQWDNTIVLFLSDNGASSEMMVRDDGHDPLAAPGSAATHLCLGPGWSTVSNTPFRRHKSWVHEGGIATPLIVHGPQHISSKGELRHQPGHVIDVWPTLTQLAGVDESALPVGGPPRPGVALNFGPPVANVDRELWWSHEGNRAIRVGDWKLVSLKGLPWELYDLSRDRTEQDDLASSKPDQAQALEARWEQAWKSIQEQASAP